MTVNSCSINALLAVVASAVSESKKAVFIMEAAIAVGVGLLAAPSAVGQELFDPDPFDSTGVLLRDPDIYNVEVLNHGSVDFLVEVDVSPDW